MLFSKLKTFVVPLALVASGHCCLASSEQPEYDPSSAAAALAALGPAPTDDGGGAVAIGHAAPTAAPHVSLDEGESVLAGERKKIVEQNSKGTSENEDEAGGGLGTVKTRPAMAAAPAPAPAKAQTTTPFEAQANPAKRATPQSATAAHIATVRRVGDNPTNTNANANANANANTINDGVDLSASAAEEDPGIGDEERLRNDEIVERMAVEAEAVAAEEEEKEEEQEAETRRKKTHKVRVRSTKWQRKNKNIINKNKKPGLRVQEADVLDKYFEK